MSPNTASRRRSKGQYNDNSFSSADQDVGATIARKIQQHHLGQGADFETEDNVTRRRQKVQIECSAGVSSSGTSRLSPSAVRTAHGFPCSTTSSYPRAKTRMRRNHGQVRSTSMPTLQRRTWWHDLLQGVALYAVCVSLPSLGGILWRYFSQTPVSNLIGGFQSQWEQLWNVATPLRGFILLFTLTFFFAVGRILIVTILNEDKETGVSQREKIEAIVRVKSIHLLSSAYTKSLTPSRGNSLSNLHTLGEEEEDGDGSPPPAPIPMISGMYEEGDVPSEQRETVEDDSSSWVERSYQAVRRSSLRSLGVEEHHSSVGSDMDALHDGDTIVVNPTRLNTAPRYATAVFRLLYSATSCFVCWLMFSSRDFWPRTVGGYGSTSNCWDLRGGTVAIQDSSTKYFDFDHMNARLKVYFIVQASYHLHSLAFHGMTVLMLWYYRGHSRPITSYWRSLLQHGIALCLIGGSYLFSATRRLGAIGSFALDVSSFFLHLMQICINAPHQLNPRTIQFVHKGLVIPSFVYCRFYVWPAVVWWSMFVESKDWLTQVSYTMRPGVARGLLVCFHLLTLVLLVLNIVLFRRLLNHPHIKRLERSTTK